MRQCWCSAGCGRWRAGRTVSERRRRHIRIGVSLQILICRTTLSKTYFIEASQGDKIPRTCVSRGGRDARVPSPLVTSCSRWAATSKSSRRQRFSRSRPPSAGAPAAWACANVRIFFPLLASATSLEASTGRCPWMAAYSSSSESPASCRPNAGLVARGLRKGGSRATHG